MKALFATLFFCLFAITTAMACDGMNTSSTSSAVSEVKTCPITGKTYNAKGEEVKAEKVAQVDASAPKVVLASAGNGSSCAAGGSCNAAAVLASVGGGIAAIFGLVFAFSKLKL